MPNDLTTYTWVLKVNQNEWDSANNCKGEEKKTISTAQNLIDKFGLHAVVITRGSKGAIAVDSENRFLLNLKRASSGYTIGCGDAFAGGFCIAIDKQQSLVEAIRLGTLSAVANVSEETKLPGQLDLGVMEKAAKEIEIRKV